MHKIIVIKIGASVLIDGSKLAQAKFKEIAQDVSSLIKRGTKVAIVSSGAIALALTRLKLRSKPESISKLQALASLGQIELMKLYQASFARYGLEVAQVLLTWDDFSQRKRYLNAQKALLQLLRYGFVPIINENDAVAIEEIKLGDNDRLSAMVASLLKADLLLILSDVDGIYDREGNLIKEVEDLKEIKKYCMGTDKRFCVGGMITKLEAAEIVGSLGIPCLISNGRLKNAIAQILNKNLGSYIRPNKKLEAKKHWLVYISKPKGAILLDAGAEEAILSKKKSVLPKGVIGVKGSFDAGDLIQILNSRREEIARGISGYSSSEIEKIKGARTSEIEALLGKKRSDEIVHRNNLVVTGGER